MTFSQILPHGFCFSGSPDLFLLPEKKYTLLSFPLWQYSLWLPIECASYFGRPASPKEQGHTPAKISNLHKPAVTFPALYSLHLHSSHHCTNHGHQQLQPLLFGFFFSIFFVLVCFSSVWFWGGFFLLFFSGSNFFLAFLNPMWRATGDFYQDFFPSFNF